MDVAEFPCEILVLIFQFLSECDRRKLSLTCYYFLDIFNSFLKDLILPHTFVVDDNDYIFERLIIWWSSYDGFFVVNEKFFDVLGPNAEVVVNLNDTLTFSIPFNQTNKLEQIKYPKLKRFSPFSFRVIQTKNCRLKFTHYHSHTYYVDGCTIEEIHARKKEPCFKCFTLEAIRFDIQKLEKTGYPFLVPHVKTTVPVRVIYPILGKRCEMPKMAAITGSYDHTLSPHSHQLKTRKVTPEILFKTPTANKKQPQIQHPSKYSKNNQHSQKVHKFNKNYR